MIASYFLACQSYIVSNKSSQGWLEQKETLANKEQKYKKRG